MTLALLQQEFMGQVLEEERPLPPAWGQRMRVGLDVYRNAYRTRLVDALRETFEQTTKWAGEESFRAAAAHYLISEPPQGWTLDRVGEGFVATLEELFANDPDVADLAWLEWAMHAAFTSPDEQPLDLEEFSRATSAFTAHDWSELRLGFVASLQLRSVASDCASLWRSLKNESAAPDIEPCENYAACLVWREDFSPVFRLMGSLEGLCLDKMIRGSTFGEICSDLMDQGDERAAATEAGAMLRRWIELGLIVAVDANGQAMAGNGNPRSLSRRP